MTLKQKFHVHSQNSKLSPVVRANVRRLAREKGMSLTMLARMAGLSHNTISSWHGQSASPKLVTLEIIATALDCTVADLVTESRIDTGDNPE